MKVHDVEQGSPEWFQLRAGIPTASEFDRILTPGGKESKSAEPYMFELLSERIMGHPRRDFVSKWMERGKELEADAALFYEIQKDMRTKKVGFVTNDAGTVGASPDRFADPNGGVEIKCPSEGVHVRYMLYGSVEQAYYPQIQGQIWIAELDWMDILSYHPEMPPALIRVERDEDYIAKLNAAVMAFSRVLEQQYQAVMERYDIEAWGYAPPPKTGTPIPQLAPLEDLVRMAKQALGE